MGPTRRGGVLTAGATAMRSVSNLVSLVSGGPPGRLVGCVRSSSRRPETAWWQLGSPSLCLGGGRRGLDRQTTEQALRLGQAAVAGTLRSQPQGTGKVKDEQAYGRERENR